MDARVKGSKPIGIGLPVFTTRAGLPTTIPPAGPPLDTTAMAPTTAPSPMLTPGRIVAPVAIQTHRPMVIGFRQQTKVRRVDIVAPRTEENIVSYDRPVAYQNFVQSVKKPCRCSNSPPW